MFRSLRLELNFNIDEIAKLPISEQREILKLLQEHEERSSLANARTSFMGYVKRMWPQFIEGRHHREMGKIYDAVTKKELNRVMIHLPPRHTKSEFASWNFPAQYFGHHPSHKIMQISNTAELASGFGRRVRDSMESREYAEIFEEVTVKADSRSAGRWNTNRGGDYFATGVGGAIAGRGADALIIDDPHTEAQAQAAVYDPKVYDDAYEWYRVGPRQRLQPGAAIIIVMTRWAKRDLAGQVFNHAVESGAIDEWKIFNFPAVFDETQNALWPEYWSYEELMRIKRDIPLYRWMSQYQQTPTTDEGAIIKRDYWKPWERDRLPEFSYILDSWDTAFTAKTTGDYSAMTRWGVFYYPDANGRPLANVMLIDSYRDRLEFPALKTELRQQYRDHHADTILIEQRGSGISLYQEMGSMGMPIEPVNTGRMGAGISNDKVARANAVVDIFKSGIVWYNPSCKLNEVTIEECSDLPRGDNDDLADTVTQALKRLRDGYFVGTQHDEDQIYDEDDETVRPRGRIY